MTWSSVTALAEGAFAHEGAVRLSELLIRTSLLHHAGQDSERISEFLLYDVEQGVKLAETVYLALEEPARERIREEVMAATEAMIADTAAELWRSCTLLGYDPGTIDASHVVMATCRRLMEVGDR